MLSHFNVFMEELSRENSLKRPNRLQNSAFVGTCLKKKSVPRIKDWAIVQTKLEGRKRERAKRIKTKQRLLVVSKKKKAKV
jgi:hypothetical protein